jgi:hypothetical protein
MTSCAVSGCSCHSRFMTCHSASDMVTEAMRTSVRPESPTDFAELSQGIYKRKQRQGQLLGRRASRDKIPQACPAEFQAGCYKGRRITTDTTEGLASAGSMLRPFPESGHDLCSQYSINDRERGDRARQNRERGPSSLVPRCGRWGGTLAVRTDARVAIDRGLTIRTLDRTGIHLRYL